MHSQQQGQFISTSAVRSPDILDITDSEFPIGSVVQRIQALQKWMYVCKYVCVWQGEPATLLKTATVSAKEGEID